MRNFSIEFSSLQAKIVECQQELWAADEAKQGYERTLATKDVDLEKVRKELEASRRELAASKEELVVSKKELEEEKEKYAELVNESVHVGFKAML